MKTGTRVVFDSPLGYLSAYGFVVDQRLAGGRVGVYYYDSRPATAQQVDYSIVDALRPRKE